MVPKKGPVNLGIFAGGYNWPFLSMRQRAWLRRDALRSQVLTQTGEREPQDPAPRLLDGSGFEQALLVRGDMG